MPVSPYSGQFYSGYAVGRPYAGTISSNYLTSALGLRASNEKTQLRSTSPGKPFLSGNTAALKETFSNRKESSDTPKQAKRYNNGNKIEDTDKKSEAGTGKSGNISENTRGDQLRKYEYKPHVSKYGNPTKSEEDDKKPKAIDTSNINISDKSPPYSSTSETTEEDKLISRNRQVVRLTIKRDKDKEKKDTVLPDNSVKTIAQKLFEKYTVKEKIKEDPLAHVPNNRLPLHVNAAKQDTRKGVDKPPNLPISPVIKTAITIKGSMEVPIPKKLDNNHENEGDGNEGDDELSADESENNQETAIKCFARATTDAAISKELVDPEAVKDAIVAAILHPAVDIESDEEIKQLVNSESSEESKNNSEKRNKRKKSKDKKKIDPQLLAKRKKSDAEIGGEMIVDKLKRYVKHQVSIERESLKNASRRPSEDIAVEALESNDFYKINEGIIIISSQNGSPQEGENKDNQIPNTKIDKDHKRVMTEKQIKGRNRNEESNQDVFSAEISSFSKDERKAEKTNYFSVSNSLERTSQTSMEGVSSTLRAPFESPNTVSIDHSIIHPENKFSMTLSFIADFASAGHETGKETLSFQWGALRNDGEMERSKKLSKGSLKSGETKNIISNDYKPNLEKEKKATGDESESRTDNSIEAESSNLKNKEKEKYIDSKGSELNYGGSKENKRKEFEETQNESKISTLGVELSANYCKEGAGASQEKSKKSKGVDLNEKKGDPSETKFLKEETRYDQDNATTNLKFRGMLMNSESDASMKERGEEREKNVENRVENELVLETSQFNKQALKKSKKTFLKTLVSKDVQKDDFSGSEKTFDLRKSATTQIFSESPLEFDTKCQRFNEAETLPSSILQDFEIKPSLRQFLEEASAEMDTNKDKMSEGDFARDIKSVVEKKESATHKIQNLTKNVIKGNARFKSDSTCIKEVDENKEASTSVKVNDFPNSVESKIGITESEKSIDTKDLVATVSKKNEPDKSKVSENKLTTKDLTDNMDLIGEKIVTQMDLKPPTFSVNEKEYFNIKSPGDENPEQGKSGTPEINLKRAKETTQLQKNSVTLTKEKTNLIDDLLNTQETLRKKSKPKEDPKCQPKVKEKVNVIEAEPKKVWKRPPPPKAPPPKSPAVDELTKVCAALKRPAFNKTPGVKSVLKTLSTVEKKEIQTLKPTNDLQPNTKESLAQKSPEKEPARFESSLDNKQGSYKTLVNERILGCSSQISEPSPGKNSSGKCSSRELLVALSPSQSADSAYGSSPSTPQPGVRAERDEKRGSKVISETRPQEDGEKNEKDFDNDKKVCELCGTNCHKKCERQMANLCGVNQKLLAEALSSVKRGSSTDGKETFRLLNAASASKSVLSVSSTEGEITTTDDDETETETDSSEYDGHAEVRAPIQTRPKYKKYNLDDFHFIKVLGKGSFGKVMLAQQVHSENYFAVKCLKKDVVLEDNDVDCCIIERKVLTLGTKHPYLCHLFCSFQTTSHLFFVMEYLTGGDLMFHIQHCGRFDEYRSCFYAAEIVSGLKFLHGKGIIYRDLKLDNILLDYEGHIRIADFGMCKLQIYLDRYADTFCGTPDYMAPEVIKGLHYNQCVDWWSFGVLMYEMMVGKSPFKGCDEDHLFWLICNEEPFYPRFLSREGQSLLKQLLDKDATRRLGPPYCPSGDIQSHQFFKYIDWSKIDRKEMEAPYKPVLRHILDVQYFDRCFTKKNAALTPVDDSILETMDQTPFKDFSYTNPNITD